MEIGIVGLGRMGAGMARRLARGGVQVVCYDRAEAAQQALADVKNVDCAENLAAMCARLIGEVARHVGRECGIEGPRIVRVAGVDQRAPLRRGIAAAARDGDEQQ